uniref:ATP-dependent DNA helicase n=1 Tax=Timema monikensis TaxID=170555 RepID=A0A7R9EIK5_9NEOP|nr:unnamed protein product [Timema monikensis]
MRLSAFGKLCGDFSQPEPRVEANLRTYDAQTEADNVRREIETLNDEQRALFADSAVKAVRSHDEGEEPRAKAFFVNGPGGSGGKTSHSLFRFPIPLDRDSVCNITVESPEAQKLKECSIIVWDEAPMAPCDADRLLRDITGNYRVNIGDKVLLFGDDFRKVLPVVRRGGRAKTVLQCLKYSPLWNQIRKFNLNLDMRADKGQDFFKRWLLQVGEGRTPILWILPEGYLEIPQQRVVPPDVDLCTDVFGDYLNEQILSSRAVPYPRKEEVNVINDYIIKRPGGDVRSFLSTVVLERQQKDEIMNTVIDYEEAEAGSRDPEKDKELFRKACDDIRTMMDEITELKTKRSEDSKGEIIDRRIKASLLFVVLKKLNRLEKFRTKTSRDTMNRVKQQVDSYHLQLQNLLYEIEHLKKEVTKCLQFKSKDEEIELVTVEEFYKEAPATLSRPEVTQTNPHQLKLARLEWELEQRKQLSALCSKLQTAKEMVGKEIQTKKERLDNLTPRLKSILEVTKPLQEYLGLPLDKIRKQHQVAYLLPKPLYVLYVQADAYREACDTLMLVSVSGDEEEARLLKNTKNEEKIVEESDSDQEDNSERDKRHHRKLSRSDRLEERKKRLLLRHPLTVHITIKLKDGNGVQLSFHYLMNLHVVTVKTRLNLENTVHGSSAL